MNPLPPIRREVLVDTGRDKITEDTVAIRHIARRPASG
jgi:hypothetical protein